MKSRGRSSSWIICWKAKRKFIRRRRTTTWASPPPTRIVSEFILRFPHHIDRRHDRATAQRTVRVRFHDFVCRKPHDVPVRKSKIASVAMTRAETIRVGGGLAKVVVLLRRMNFLFAFQQIIQEEDRPRLFISNPIEWNRRTVRELDTGIAHV